MSKGYHPANLDLQPYPHDAVIALAEQARRLGVLFHINGIPFGADFDKSLLGEASCELEKSGVAEAHVSARPPHPEGRETALADFERLSDEDRRRVVASYLNCNPNTPGSWPEKTIDYLVGLRLLSERKFQERVNEMLSH